ncbi:MAG: thiamine-phosphate kinase [Candidatus Heimdallarchaeota archaeon]|nr:thiamine-phosphate kinase [Candidatus Heimdallarchaeota archaeon]
MDHTIKSIGERGLLALFEKLVDQGDLPFNEDAVAFPLSSDTSMVVNIDTFVAKTDAPPTMTAYQMGAKAVIMAISDLAAKGVRPQYLIASIALPDNYSIEQTVDLVKGIQQTAHYYNCKFLGGDTNAAMDVIITIVVLGEIKKSLLMKRSGANESDVICTTGLFGLTGAGFRIFLENVKATDSQRKIFREAIFTPKARVKEGLILVNFKKVTSCIDSSDGLGWCFKEILRNKKNLGIRITNLPIHDAVKEFANDNNLSANELALYAGEEFELVFTLPEKYVKPLSRLLDFHVIGQVVFDEHERILLQVNDQIKPIDPRGWEHFTNHKIKN